MTRELPDDAEPELTMPPSDALPPPSPLSEAGPRASGVPDPLDVAFFEALRSHGLLVELTDGMLAAFLDRASDQPDADARRLDVLELYFDAVRDPSAADPNGTPDRAVFVRAGAGSSARSVVSALAGAFPSLGEVTMERLGGDDGPLVLRNGDMISAVDDEVASEGGPSVAVRALVAAFNVLVERSGEERRLVPVRGDGRRELYVALPRGSAITLNLGAHLEPLSSTELMALGAY